MKKIIFTLIVVFVGFSIEIKAQEQNPNILLITLDDMNWDSLGALSGSKESITPHMDELAKMGKLFEYSYVQAPNCSPSRSVIQTGLYPHQSGMRGFYYVQQEALTLPEILMENNYFTGVINKTSDSSLSPDFKKYWNYSIGLTGGEKRSSKKYSSALDDFFSNSKNSKKPFYCLINIADPHKPFFNDQTSKKKGYDTFKPSRVLSADEVEVPDFLPKHSKIKQEVLNYYNSVRRGDDCVGEILSILKRNNLEENTLILLLSDHGMPFPFAKSSLYENGVRTPLIVSWKNNIAPNSIDSKNMISAIDIAPTLLDIIGVDPPEAFSGMSFAPALKEMDMNSSPYVFAQFDENAGGVINPSRTVISKKYGYIFNPWSNGKNIFQSASTFHTTYKAMRELSKTDDLIKIRFNHWNYRVLEEFYDYEKDPNALINLIDDEKYRGLIKKHREALLIHMQETNDYVLPAFENRYDDDFLKDWIQLERSNSEIRRKTIAWKRYKNKNGATKKNKGLYDAKLETKTINR